MDLQTGDIGIAAASWPGHVMMCYSGGSDSSAKTVIIHATNSGNFHKTPQTYQQGCILGYRLDSSTTWIFRPPWDDWKKRGGDPERKKEELRSVADAIVRSATYGLYRAVRLFAGDSSYGADAQARRKKYMERKAMALAGGNKLVTTVTCAEAVIIAYQLVFSEQDAPFFIRKDAAHTMPRTLRDWLKANKWQSLGRGD